MGEFFLMQIFQFSIRAIGFESKLAPQKTTEVEGSFCWKTILMSVLVRKHMNETLSLL